MTQITFDTFGELYVNGIGYSSSATFTTFDGVSSSGAYVFQPRLKYEAWDNRMKLVVSNPPTVEAQASFTLTYKTGMQSDFADIRFATLDGIEIPHWKETYTASTTCKVWLKLPADDNVIQVIYGNSDADDSSNGNDVFEWFCEFSEYLSQSLPNDGHWTSSGYPWISSAHQLVMDSTKAADSALKFGMDRTFYAIGVADEQDFDALRLKNGTDDLIRFCVTDNATYGGIDGDFQHISMERKNAGTGAVTGVDTGHYITDNNTYEIRRFADGEKIEFYINGDIVFTESDSSYISTAQLSIGTSTWSPQESTYTIDAFMVGVCIDIAPTITETVADFNPYADGYVWNAMKYSMVVDITNSPTINAAVKYNLDWITNMDTSFNDVRFAADGVNVEYWRESYSIGTSAVFWLKLPHDTSRINVYFCNTSAVYAGNGHAVFELFNDGTSLDGFTTEDGEPSISSGIITLTDAYPDPQILTSNKMFGSGYVLEGLIQANTVRKSLFGFYDYYNNDWHGAFWRTESGSVWTPECVSADAWTYGSNVSNVSESYITAKIEWISDSSIKFYTGGTLRYSATTNIPQVDCHVAMRADSMADTTVLNVDWLRVYPYIATEPTFTENAVSYNIGYRLYSWTGFEKQSTIIVENSHPVKHVPMKVELAYADYTLETDAVDMRFCDVYGNYLPYWIESDDATDIVAWTIAPANSTRIFMRCGNSSATSESSQSPFHIYYNRFDSFDGWSVYTGKTSMQLNDTRSLDGTYSAAVRASYSDCMTQDSIDWTIDEHGVEIIADVMEYASAGNMMLSVVDSNGKTFYVGIKLNANSDKILTRIDAEYSYTVMVDVSSLTWYQLSMKLYRNGTIELYGNDTLLNSSTWSGTVSFIRIGSLWAGSTTTYMDRLRVRNLYDSSPTTYTFPEGYSPAYAVPASTLDDFVYYKALTVTNPHTSAYPKQITVTYDSDMETDFSDLLFVSHNVGLQCPHWIETYSDSSSATIWVLTPANISQIDMYYNYDGTWIDRSNGEQVFLLHDGFDGSASSAPNTNKWHTSWLGNIEGTILHDGNSNIVLDAVDASSGSITLSTNMLFTHADGIQVIEKLMLTDNDQYADVCIGQLYDTLGEYGLTGNQWHGSAGKNSITYAIQDGSLANGAVNNIRYYSAQTTREVQTNSTNVAMYPSMSVYYTSKYNWSVDEISMYTDDVLVISDASPFGTFEKSYVHFYQGGYVTHNPETTRSVDWIGIREYVATEPSISIGTETSNPLYSGGYTSNLIAGFMGANT